MHIVIAFDVGDFDSGFFLDLSKPPSNLETYWQSKYVLRPTNRIYHPVKKDAFAWYFFAAKNAKAQ